MKPDTGIERRRELNRVAAQKLRNRQKERAVNIRQEYFNAQSNNTRLVYEKKQLYKERDALKSSLEAHLQFCQQHAASNLFHGNHIIYVAPSIGSLSQPIFLMNVEQSTSGRISLSDVNADSRGESDAVDDSNSASSVKEDYDETIAREKVESQTDDTLKTEENIQGDTPPLVIIEDGVQNLKDQSESAVLHVPEFPVTNDKNVENKSTPDVVIPLMVLDMELAV